MSSALLRLADDLEKRGECGTLARALCGATVVNIESLLLLRIPFGKHTLEAEQHKIASINARAQRICVKKTCM